MTPQDPPTAPRRVTRSSGDKLLAGVAAGLARQFGVDPALMRIAFVVLVFFGGAGIALYAVLWLLLPTDDGAYAIGPDASNARKALLIGLILVAIVALPFSGPGFFVAAPFVLALAVLAAIGVLIWGAVGGEGSPSLTRAAWLVLAVAGALLLGLGAGVAAAFGAGTVVAIIVLAVGVAMVIAGFAGGARWLVIPALVMALPLAVVSAADIDLTGGVGERDYRPTSVLDLSDSYRLGVGDLVVDLRDVDFPSGRTDLGLHVGMGRVALTVPEDVCVQLDARIGAGELEAFDRLNNGVDVRVERRPSAPADGSTLVVDASAGIGRIDVEHPGGGRFGQPACA